MTEIRADLRPYVPASLYDGENLKAGVTAEQATKIAEGVQAAVKDLPDAQAKIFLEILASPDLAPDGRIPENFGEAIQTLATVLERVGSGTPFQDSLAVLARLMIEQAAENRKDALQDRLSSREMARTQLLSQAQTSLDAADKIKDGAKTAMIVSIVLAAVSILASAISIAGGAKGASDATKFTQQTGSVAGFANTSRLAASSQTVGSLSQTAGQVGQSGSSYATSEVQAETKELDAQGQIAAAQAQNLQAQADVSKEFMDAMGDAIKQIINFLKEIQDAQAQAMQTLTRV